MHSNLHKVKRGLDIRIPGTSERVVTELPLRGYYAVRPTDYVGVAPRLFVSEGDSVLVGTPLFEDKDNEGVPFVSPVSGRVKAIIRGERRTLSAVVVEADVGGADNDEKVGSSDSGNTWLIVDDDENAEGVRQRMIMSGLWNRLRQRPFGIVPRMDSHPKAVFVSAFDSSPLPVDLDFVLRGREEDFQHGIDVIHKMVGRVCLSLDGTCQRGSFLATTANADIHFFEGPHPSGLVGTQIACISPINKGETVWTVNPQDVAIIGHYFRTGEYLPERTVALCGPGVDRPQYFHLTEGAQVCSVTNGRLVPDVSKTGHLRIVCGDVLSGISVGADEYIGSGCDKVSVIPEGDYYDFMGWLRPNFRKYSFSRTFLSGMLSRFRVQRLKFDFDTGQHGSHRPLFVTGEFEKLVPLDIYPMQLVKACIVGDIDMMEELGIYEIEPEDLALCEFADTSKTEIQAIVRNALEKIRREG